MAAPHRRPPLVGRALLKLVPLAEDRRQVEEDLIELFDRRVRARGRRYAAWRYVLDVLSLWRVSRGGAAIDRRREWTGLGGMREDLRFAVRMFSRQPGIVAIAIGGLALAIGLGTAIFTLLHAVALRGPGVAEPASVYRLFVQNLDMPRLTGGTSAMSGNWSAQDFVAVRSAAKSVDTAASAIAETRTVRIPSIGERTEVVQVMPVSGAYFSVLGGRARLGRALTPQDDLPGSAPVLCVSHTFWKTRLDADPHIIGTAVWLDDVSFTVVGVADRDFRGVGPAPPALWLTFAAQATLWAGRQGERAETARGEIARLQRQSSLTAVQRARLEALTSELAAPPGPWNQPVDVVGRLRPSVSPQQAATEVTAIARARAAGRGQPEDRRPSLALASIDERSNPALMAAAGVTLMVVALLLLLACGNIANLLLANAAGRRREIGMRLALGASRGRIVRQLLTESLLLGSVGGTAGLLMGLWLTPVLARLLDAPPLLDLEPDGRVYLCTAAMTVLTGLLAGVAPARYGRRGDLLGALQSDRLGAPGTAAPSRLRAILIGGQAAGSILLLVVAALFTRSFVQATSFDLGFDADRLVRVSIPFSRGYDVPRRMVYWDAALERVRELPEVSGASLAVLPPFAGGYAPHRLPADAGGSRQAYVLRNEVSAEYFGTAGIRVLRGRTFTLEEVRSEAPVAVISAGLARRFWPDEDPLGATFDRVWGPADAPDARPAGLLRKPPGTQVIGVVGEAITRFGSHDAPTVYLPLSASAIPAVHMVVATAGDPARAIRRIEDALLSVDSSLQPTSSRIRDGIDGELRMPAAVAATTGLFGAAAVTLAAIGLFGVTAFVVGQRRQEVSVRMALGATGGAILRMLLRDSLRPVVFGMACGLGLALLAGQAISRVLYGVSGHDPVAVAAAVLVLTGASTAAALFPALQAARVSPAEMLKQS